MNYACVMTLRVFVLLGLFAAAIVDTSLAGPSDGTKYWVFFTDKSSAAKVAEPDVVSLSERAQFRRLTRASIDENARREIDRPVSSTYVGVLSEMGIETVVRSRWLNAVSAVIPVELLHQVHGLPFVRDVRPVGVAVHNEAPPVPVPLQQPVSAAAAAAATRLDYGAAFDQLSLVNAIPPLENGINGAGVRLGIIDTEFDGFVHPAFQKLVSEGRLIDYQNFVGVAQANEPRGLHGRQVASIAVAFDDGSLIGPAYGAELLAATTEYVPTETNQEEDNFVAGLEWMESLGVDVVNVSLAYTDFDDGQRSYSYSDMDGDTGVTTIAADIAAQLGVVMVVAAGNYGCSSPSNCWYYVGTPADADSVVAVGATFSSGSKAFFSSFGPTFDGRTKPDVAAMGAGTYFASFGTDYGSGLGTSYAAPMVAGIACQILQVNPNLKPMEVRHILRSTASQSQSPDNALGWGIVDAQAAVDMAMGTVGVEEESVQTAINVSTYPNPFAERVTFTIETTSPYEPVTITVYDVMGRVIAAPETKVSVGGTSVEWHADDLAAGLYVYVVQAGKRTYTGRLVHL